MRAWTPPAPAGSASADPGPDPEQVRHARDLLTRRPGNTVALIARLLRVSRCEVAEPGGGASPSASKRCTGDSKYPHAYAGDRPVEVMDTISHGEVVSHRFEIRL
jgi:hypothetical protein